MSRVIHGIALSPYFRKVLVALEEKGLDYRVEETSPGPDKPPALLEMNPLGQIPVLREGDLVLPDSSVICAYLERAHPDAPSIFPADPAALGRALFLEEYADTALSDAVSGLVFENLVRVRFLGEQPDPQVVARLENEQLPASLDYLETRVAAGELGGGLDIADIAVGAQLQGLQFLQREIETDRWPGLAAWAGALLARPSFHKALA